MNVLRGILTIVGVFFGVNLLVLMGAIQIAFNPALAIGSFIMFSMVSCEYGIFRTMNYGRAFCVSMAGIVFACVLMTFRVNYYDVWGGALIVLIYEIIDYKAKQEEALDEQEG